MTKEIHCCKGPYRHKHIKGYEERYDEFPTTSSGPVRRPTRTGADLLQWLPKLLCVVRRVGKCWEAFRVYGLQGFRVVGLMKGIQVSDGRV